MESMIYRRNHLRKSDAGAICLWAMRKHYSLILTALRTRGQIDFNPINAFIRSDWEITLELCDENDFRIVHSASDGMIVHFRQLGSASNVTPRISALAWGKAAEISSKESNDYRRIGSFYVRRLQVCFVMFAKKMHRWADDWFQKLPTVVQVAKRRDWSTKKRSGNA